MTDKPNELLGCPHCGKPPREAYRHLHYKRWFVHPACECQALRGYKTREQAVEAWNRRHHEPLDDEKAEVAILRAELASLSDAYATECQFHADDEAENERLREQMETRQAYWGSIRDENAKLRAVADAAKREMQTRDAYAASDGSDCIVATEALRAEDELRDALAALGGDDADGGRGGASAGQPTPPVVSQERE